MHTVQETVELLVIILQLSQTCTCNHSLRHDLSLICLPYSDMHIGLSLHIAQRTQHAASTCATLIFLAFHDVNRIPTALRHDPAFLDSPT